MCFEQDSLSFLISEDVEIFILLKEGTGAKNVAMVTCTSYSTLSCTFLKGYYSVAKFE